MQLKYSQKIINKLNESDSIIGRDNFTSTSVLLPIIELKGEEHLLFEKRSDSVKQPGEVSFPGGHFDPAKDKNLLETAVRETIEELGLNPNKIKYLGKLGSLVTPMRIVVDAFVVKLSLESIDTLRFDTNEVEMVFTIPINFFIENAPEQYYSQIQINPYKTDENGNKNITFPAKELGFPSRYSKPWSKGKHRILVYRTKPEIVWGITAELVYEFIRKIKDNPTI